MLAALLRGGATGVALSPLPLLRALLQTILAPLLVGISARAFVPGEPEQRSWTTGSPVFNALESIKRNVLQQGGDSHDVMPEANRQKHDAQQDSSVT